MEWPPEFASIVKTLSRQLGYTALVPIRELSGKSGAQTYACLPESAAGRPFAVIVKIGAKAVLDADINGLVLAQSMFRDAHEMLNFNVQSGGIVAVPLKIASDNAILFSEWYRLADPQHMRKVIRELFTDVLRLGNLTLSPVNQNAFSQYTIHDPKTFAAALRELGPEGAGLWEWWLHGATAAHPGTLRRLAHGDLHGRNILITTAAERPYVIDFGATGLHHFPLDLAKLEREIWLRLFRPAERDRTVACAELAAVVDTRSDTDSEALKATEALDELRALAAEFAVPGVCVTDEYEIALLAQFMFAAANRAEARSYRRAALGRAVTLRKQLENRHADLRMLPDSARRRARRSALSRLAYALLRLDQLPNGGWGRSVASWMETLWAGDKGTITRNPSMRKVGGTDVTCSNLIYLVTFLLNTLGVNDCADLLLENQAVELAGESIVARKSSLGGVSSLSSTRTSTDVHLRHTLMAVLALLYDELGHHGGHGRPDVVNEMAGYLVTYVPRWDVDTSHLFGSCMAAAKLRELLDTEISASLDADISAGLRTAMDVALPAMLSGLYTEKGRDHLRPEPPPDVKLGPPFFWPYGGFWRMERSSFLMYTSLGIQQDRQRMLPCLDSLAKRLASCFRALLSEIAVPFDPAKAEESLLFYHAHRGNESSARRDWGLSAELAALLRTPAIISLLQANGYEDAATLMSKREALERALVETFDAYTDHPEIFHHTHAAPFARVLDTLDDAAPSLTELRDIDADIRILQTEGATEWALDRFLGNMLTATAAKASDVDKESVLRFLVAKLEAGRYKPDERAWARVLERTDTVSAYRGDRAASFAEHAKDKELRLVPSIITRVLGSADGRQGRALDLGCGPGRHAALVAGMGFAVELVDLSEDMLRIAAERIGAPVPAPADMRRLSFGPSSFDLVVAAESVMHITKAELPRLLADIHRFLRPGGVFYASFQIGNHALVTRDGRFYEYYPDDVELSELLSSAGLPPRYVFPWPYEPYELDLYPSSSSWEWVDFYCIKADE